MTMPFTPENMRTAAAQASPVVTDVPSTDDANPPEPTAPPAEPETSTTPETTSTAEGDLELVVKGETSTVTREEAVKLAQQGLYAQQEIKKARELQKQLEDEKTANADLLTIGQSFKDNPQGAVQTLVNSGLIDVSSFVPTPPSEEDEFMTDEQKEIRALKAQLDEVQHAQAVTQRRSELDVQAAKVADKYGVDADGLVQHAANNGLLGNLEAAYAHMNLDTISAGEAALKADQLRQEALDGKRDAQGIQRGGSVASSASQAGSVDAPTSTEEAVAQALRGEVVDPAVANRPLAWLKNRA